MTVHSPHRSIKITVPCDFLCVAKHKTYTPHIKIKKYLLEKKVHKVSDVVLASLKMLQCKAH